MDDSIEAARRLIASCGGIWAVEHAERVIGIADRIAGGRAYDRRLLELAAFLHDLGAFAPYAIRGVDHAERSAEVIPATCRPWLDEQTAVAVAGISALHHRAGPGDRIESILLSDADALDLVGAVGVARALAACPGGMESALRSLTTRISMVRGRFVTTEARLLGEPRFAYAEEFVRRLGSELA